MSHKFSALLLIPTLFVAGTSFADHYNPNDPIGWDQSTSFPVSVTQNSGIYSATFTFANQTGNTVPYFGMLLNAKPAAAFSIGYNTCNQTLTTFATCEIQVNLNTDSSLLPTGTATIQANPNYAVFNVLVPQPGDSITVTAASPTPPPTPPAPPPGSNFIMWSLPSTVISYPVYAYVGTTQVNYIPTSSTQAFLGAYPSGVENKTYTLYYQPVPGSGPYVSCNVAFTSSGTIDSGTTTCSGATINPPKATSSNVYTLAVGATAFTGSAQPSSPTVPLYSDRGLLFKNDTGHSAILVQGTCKNLSVCNTSAGYSTVVDAGTPVWFPVGLPELNSGAFYVTAYCTDTILSGNCSTTGTDPILPSGSGWVQTGGYNSSTNSGKPYATKVEATFLTTSTTTPSGASNVDVSAVDGYNIAVQLYPGNTLPSSPYVSASGAYCTYTVPPEGSNVLGAGFYQTKASGTPLAQVPTAQNIQTLCTNSSQLPPGNTGTAWALTVPAASFIGCMSPCTYATKTHDPDQDLFCCSGAYNTPETCDATSGTTVAANTSTYTINTFAHLQNVYPYAFGDAGSDYACEADKSYVVDFISTTP